MQGHYTSAGSEPDQVSMDPERSHRLGDESRHSAVFGTKQVEAKEGEEDGSKSGGTPLGAHKRGLVRKRGQEEGQGGKSTRDAGSGSGSGSGGSMHMAGVSVGQEAKADEAVGERSTHGAGTAPVHSDSPQPPSSGSIPVGSSMPSLHFRPDGSISSSSHALPPPAVASSTSTSTNRDKYSEDRSVATSRDPPRSLVHDPLKQEREATSLPTGGGAETSIDDAVAIGPSSPSASELSDESSNAPSDLQAELSTYPFPTTPALHQPHQLASTSTSASVPPDTIHRHSPSTNMQAIPRNDIVSQGRTLPTSTRTPASSMRRPLSAPGSPRHRSRSVASSPAVDFYTASSSSHQPRDLGKRAHHPAARVDPDQHWLSEDGGTHDVGDYLAGRRRERRHDLGEGPSRRRDDDDDRVSRVEGKDAQQAPQGGNSEPNLKNGGMYGFSGLHDGGLSSFEVEASRRSALSPLHPNRSPSPAYDIARLPVGNYLIPMLLHILRCPVCKKPLKDASTLGCGHSICLACTEHSAEALHHASASSPSSMRTSESTHSPLSDWLRNRTESSATNTSEISQVSSDPVSAHARTLSSARTPSIEPPPPTTSPLTGGIFGRTFGAISNTFGRNERISPPRNRSLCPHERCRASGRAVPGPFEPRVDVVIQKILNLLLKEVPDLYKPEVSDATRAATAFARSSPPAVALDVSPLSEADRDSPSADYPSGLVGGIMIDDAAERLSRTSSSSVGSGSSIEDPEGEQNKRGHHSRWRSVKKARRLSDPGSQTHTTKASNHMEMESMTDPHLVFVSNVLSEMECQVCFMLFYEPITTPCGHTFCKKCLARSLDHSQKCPLCRSDLPGFTYFQDHPFNASILALLMYGYGSLLKDRKVAIETDERDSQSDTPLFVCSLAFPNMPMFLHVFEPRYRLMMRRCMETNSQFGMILPSRAPGSQGIHDYGTMLEIKSMQLLQDGRSTVETIGLYRFKVLEKGTLDGYAVGRIERIDDISAEQEAEMERVALARNHDRMTSAPSTAAPTANDQSHGQGETGSRFGHPGSHVGGTTGPDTIPQPAPSNPDWVPLSIDSAGTLPTAPPGSFPGVSDAWDSPNLGDPSQPELSTSELMDICRDFLETLRSGSAPWLLQRLNNTFGPLPDNPSDFSYWMAAVVPIDEYEKARLLRITSPRLRLKLLACWIEQMRSTWWFATGCMII